MLFCLLDELVLKTRCDGLKKYIQKIKIILAIIGQVMYNHIRTSRKENKMKIKNKEFVISGCIVSLGCIIGGMYNLVKNGLWIEEKIVLGIVVQERQFNYVPFVIIFIGIILMVFTCLVERYE